MKNFKIPFRYIRYKITDMSSFVKLRGLSKLNNKELISLIIELKSENNCLNEENCLLKTELNEYKNESKNCQSKKRQKSSGSEALDRQTVNKKSFSDRICDDLCEEILQYLSLEDKLKLEGVSKQFQRTIFQKHYELTIETDNHIPKRKVEKKFKYLYIEDIFIDLKSLEVLLKKCPNITSINLKKVNLDFRKECDYNEVFRLITKYCDNLRQIKFGNQKISDENIEEFQRKFGPKIDYISHLKDPVKYNLFPNIEKLKFHYRDHMQDVVPLLKLNKLRKLKVTINEGEEHMIQTWVDTLPKLTHFGLRSYCGIEEESSIFNSLELISNLKNLKHFEVYIFQEGNEKLFCDSLKRMANKCQKLKSIKCEFHITTETRELLSHSLRQRLSSLTTFPSLKRLNLWFIFHDEEDEFCINEFFSFEAFKGLSNITHLTLRFDEYWDQNENFANILTDIDINLPNLQYFEFKNEITATEEDVTQMADILSRLSRLQTLKLEFSEGIDCNEIEVKIREKCRKIRTIDIKQYNWELISSSDESINSSINSSIDSSIDSSDGESTD